VTVAIEIPQEHLHILKSRLIANLDKEIGMVRRSHLSLTDALKILDLLYIQQHICRYKIYEAFG